jgi:replicative DNA helicase
MNVEAEQALLGGLLINNSGYLKVADFLRPEHFVDPMHGRIYEAMAGLIEANKVASPITLKPLFEREGALEAVGGVGYLGRLAGAAVSIIDLDDYGRQIADLYTRRQLAELGSSLVARACAPTLEETGADLLKVAEAELFEITRPGETKAVESIALRQASSQAMAALEERYRNATPRGLRTGLASLDTSLGPMNAGDLIVVAGRPSMGKSSLALGIALHNAARFKREASSKVVAFFSLEMTADQLGAIALGQAANVPPHRVEIGRASKQDMDRLLAADRGMLELPLIINDRAQATPGFMRSQLRRLELRHDIGLIVIDHLHIMATDKPRRDGNKTVEIGELSGACKAIAKQFEAPVMLLAQLNRGNEAREDKRPTLSDLRQSGDIEQDADVVLLVHRDEYYLERAEPRQNAKQLEVDRWQADMEAARGKAHIIIAKQRRGPKDAVMVAFDGPLQRFSDLMADRHG